MEELNVYSVPVIAAICYSSIELLKKFLGSEIDEKITNSFPIISAVLGMFLAMFAYWTEPAIVGGESLLGASLSGIASGLTATGSNQILKQIKKMAKQEDDGPTKYYITGDKHRSFSGLIRFCRKNKLRKKDVIIILGDTGFNYYCDEKDDELKAKLNRENVTLLCIYGNREKRPETINTYGQRNFCGGKVYYEPKYPNLLFAIDGEIYNIGGREYLCIGGANSVDRERRIAEGLPYYEDEKPSEDLKKRIEELLDRRGNTIYGFLTHTCPVSVLPREMLLSVKKDDTDDIVYPLNLDHSTETWLESLRTKTSSTVWYCGHYHIDKEIDDVTMVYNKIIPLPLESDTNDND